MAKIDQNQSGSQGREVEGPRGNSEDHRRDDEHRPDEVPPKEPPGQVIKPRPTHGNN